MVIKYNMVGIVQGKAVGRIAHWLCVDGGSSPSIDYLQEVETTVGNITISY